MDGLKIVIFFLGLLYYLFFLVLSPIKMFLNVNCIPSCFVFFFLYLNIKSAIIAGAIYLPMLSHEVGCGDNIFPIGVFFHIKTTKTTSVNGLINGTLKKKDINTFLTGNVMHLAMVTCDRFCTDFGHLKQAHRFAMAL